MSTRTDTSRILGYALGSFGDVVRHLEPALWRAPSLCPGWNVRHVVAHVTTIESALVGWSPSDENPFASMPRIADELAELDDDALLARFDEIVTVRLDELASMTDEEFVAPSVTPVGPGTYARFMQIRVFDTWVHERDIRVPLALPGDDGGVAAEMALDEVRSALGYIVGKRIGLADGSSIEIVLTGPVHATLRARVDGRAQEVDRLDHPTVVLETDSLTFMLLACGRIDPEEAIAERRVTWSGDEALAAHAARRLAFTR